MGFLFSHSTLKSISAPLHKPLVQRPFQLSSCTVRPCSRNAVHSGRKCADAQQNW